MADHITDESTYVVFERDSETGKYRLRAGKDFDLPGTMIHIEAGTYGGLVSNPDIIANDGTCWIDKDVIVIDSTISGTVYIGGNASVTNSIINGNIKIFDNASITDSTIKGNVKIYGNAIIDKHCNIDGNITIYDDAQLIFHVNINASDIVIRDKAFISGPIDITQNNILLTKDMTYDLKEELLIRYGKPDKYNRYKVYKIVKSTYEDNVFKSYYDQNFIYDLRKSKIISDTYYDEDITKICASGLHVTFNEDYNWPIDMIESCNRILTCYVDADDIITIKNDKARVKKLTVSEVREYPIDKDSKPLAINHSLNCKYLIHQIYNNSTYNVTNPSIYRTFITDNNSILTRFYFPDTDEVVDNYNVVILGSLPEYETPISYPLNYKETIIGNGKERAFIIKHALKTRNLIVSVYDLKTLMDITNSIQINLIDQDNVVITFNDIIPEGSKYRVLIVKPTSIVGQTTSRGSSACTPRSFSYVYPGKDIEMDKLAINIPHNYGSLDTLQNTIDLDSKEAILNCTYTRKDNNTLTVQFNNIPYQNHYYCTFVTYI